GLDLSAYLLEIARKEAAAAGVEVEFLEADMRAIPRPSIPYDAVINMFSAYGYLENDVEDQKSLRAAAGVLRKGGTFLLDAMNREAAIRHWQPWRWSEQENGSLFAERMRFDIREGRQYVTEVLVRADGRRTTDSYSYRLYAYTEIARQLGEEGFSPESFEVWGDFDSSRYRVDSPRMIVLAKK
ncbi:MAG TPA: methyltransferase domain-containing protein, partial [Capsulimonadaceae bacterium]|nr:methyltransferase domain-containing protein [Capsulimonadaceae bacterium]